MLWEEGEVIGFVGFFSSFFCEIGKISLEG